MPKTSYFYHVTTPTGEHIVEAGSQSAAVNHVMRKTVKVKNLTARDLVYLQREKNLQIETAKAEAADDAPAKLKDQPNEEKPNV